MSSVSIYRAQVFAEFSGHGNSIQQQLNGFKYCYQMPIIQFNNHLFAQSNGLKFSKWLNSSIWIRDGTLTEATNQS